MAFWPHWSVRRKGNSADSPATTGRHRQYNSRLLQPLQYHPLSLTSPLLGRWVCAGAAGTLLNVVGLATATTAQRVCLVAAPTYGLEDTRNTKQN